MVVVMAGIFCYLNYQVMEFVKEVFAADLASLKATPAAPRIVDSKVLMALIGATAAQVGVSIIAIVSYLFPKDKRAAKSR